MATSIIPSIGTTGIFTLTTPFDTLLTPNVQYTCKGVRSLEDISSSGVDPFSTYYQPKGISQAAYAVDLAAGVCIISLLSSSGQMQYVPSSYIQQYPATGGIPYTVMALAVVLAAIPDSIDLSGLKQQYTDIAMNTLGIPVTITEVQLSPTSLVSQATSTAMEATRQANITNTTTDSAKLQAKENQLISAQQQIALLQDYIKTHLAPSTPAPTP